MIKVKKIYLRLKNLSRNKNYLFKFKHLKFFFIFYSFFIFQNIFAQIDEELLLSIQKRDFTLVQSLLQQGANPNIKNDHGITPLFAAVLSGHLKIVELLLKAGADPNSKDKYGDTLLCLAIKHQNFKMILLLLNNGANPFLNFRKKNNFLKRVIYSHNLQIIRLIVHHKAFIENISKIKMLKLIAIAIGRNADPEVIQLLIASAPKISFKKIIKSHFLNKAFQLFADENLSFRAHSLLSIECIHLRGMHIFLALLIWYKYEAYHVVGFNFKTNIPNSIKQLVQKIINLDSSNITNIVHKRLLNAVKSLVYWILNEMPAIESSADFFKQIFQYLQSQSHFPEEQYVLLENIRYLTLKEYFFNPNISDKSDFENVKKALKGIQLNNFQIFENNLRYLYAQELKVKLFSSFDQEDLMKAFYLNAKMSQENDLNMMSDLKNFSLINNLMNVMLSYCQSTHVSISSFIKNVSEKIQVLQNDTIVKWVNNIPASNYSDMPALIKKILKQGYNEPMGQLCHDIYQHLEHIIQTHGADINSDTQFKGNDILDFKK